MASEDPIFLPLLVASKKSDATLLFIEVGQEAQRYFACINQLNTN